MVILSVNFIYYLLFFTNHRANFLETTRTEMIFFCPLLISAYLPISQKHWKTLEEKEFGGCQNYHPLTYIQSVTEMMSYRYYLWQTCKRNAIFPFIPFDFSKRNRLHHLLWGNVLHFHGLMFTRRVTLFLQ